MRSPQGNREVFRLTPPLIFWWVWVAFVVANVADFAIQGAQARFAIVVSAILVTITGLAYALALRPRVIAESSGLTIVNPFRDHHVPWAVILAVDTGDWVRVHYAPGGPAGQGASASSAASNVVSCWALYISARAKRKAARPAQQPRSGLLRPLPASVFATPPPQQEYSRMPEEAKYLASLPAANAIAVRLDTRAARERHRPLQAATENHPVTASWAWVSAAAVVLPALALLIVVLA